MRLVAFDYPGNVRQLENICHWLTVMAPAQLVDADDLPPEVRARTERSAPAGSGQATRDGAPQPTSSLPVDPRESAAAPALDVAAGRARAAPRADDPARDWLGALERRARQLLLAGEPMVWETLTREFEAQLIRSALETTRGRRIEAALKLGIGRNTITRKIQELGLDDK